MVILALIYTIVVSLYQIWLLHETYTREFCLYGHKKASQFSRGGKIILICSCVVYISLVAMWVFILLGV
jgi:hypothetical protein